LLVSVGQASGQTGAREPLVYQAEKGDYALTLPPEWRQITKTEFDAQGRLFKEQTGNAPPRYDAGFQLSSKEAFDYPYILVKHDSSQRVSFEGLKAEVNSRIRDKAASAVGPMHFTAAGPIEERKIIVADFESSSDGESAVKGMAAICVGKYGVVYLYFYSLRSEYREYSQVFQRVLDSFKYLPGYEYDEVTSAESNTHAKTGDMVSKALLGAVFALLSGWLRKGKDGSK